MQKRTGVALRRILCTPRQLRSAVIRVNGLTQTLPPVINHDQQTLIDALTNNNVGH